MFALEADCKTPLASHASREGEELVLRAFRAEVNGDNPREVMVRAPFPKDEATARAIGIELGKKLG